LDLRPLRSTRIYRMGKAAKPLIGTTRKTLVRYNIIGLWYNMRVTAILIFDNLQGRLWLTTARRFSAYMSSRALATTTASSLLIILLPSFSRRLKNKSKSQYLVMLFFLNYLTVLLRIKFRNLIIIINNDYYWFISGNSFQLNW